MATQSKKHCLEIDEMTDSKNSNQDLEMTSSSYTTHHLKTFSIFLRGVVDVGSVGSREPTDFWKALLEPQIKYLENYKSKYGEPTDSDF